MKPFFSCAACLASLAVAVLALEGCGENQGAARNVGTPVPSQNRYRVRADSTAFYRYGPQQANGPDLSIAKGNDVLMVKRSFGYSQVQTVNAPQQTGYVSTEDISPLTQPELAALTAATATPPPVASSGSSSRRKPVGTGGLDLSGRTNYNLPPPGTGAQDELPAPSGNGSTPPPNNMFRY